MEAPFLCIRVVTRGLYPTLVNQNVRSHLEVANKVGLTNFVVEVVTDNQFDLDLTDHQVKYVKQTIGNTNTPAFVCKEIVPMPCIKSMILLWPSLESDGK